MPPVIAQPDEATRLATLAHLGIISPADFERLGDITLRHCRIEAAKQVKRGVTPIYDLELLATESAAKCFAAGLAKFDASKAQWGTYCQRITAHCAVDEARLRSRQQVLKIRLLNEEAIQAAAEGGNIDLRSLAPSRQIRQNPEALYDWNQQIGKWQGDGLVPSYAELQALKKRILREYNL